MNKVVESLLLQRVCRSPLLLGCRTWSVAHNHICLSRVITPRALQNYSTIIRSILHCASLHSECRRVHTVEELQCHNLNTLLTLAATSNTRATDTIIVNRCNSTRNMRTVTRATIRSPRCHTCITHKVITILIILITIAVSIDTCV